VIRSGSQTVTFQHALLICGRIAGTWRTVRDASGIRLDVFPLRRLSRSERTGVAKAAARYARFLDAPVSVSIA
jgi:hypothetical protein